MFGESQPNDFKALVKTKEGKEEKSPIIELSSSQMQALEDALEVLREKNPGEPNLQRLEKVRHAVIVLDAARFVEIATSVGIDLGKLSFPDSYEAAIEENTSEDLNYKKTIEGDLLFSLSQAVYYSGMAADEKRRSAIDESRFVAFKRRIEFFKRCKDLSRQTGISPEDIAQKRASYQKWIRENVDKVVDVRVPKALTEFSDGLKNPISEAISGVELNQGCSVGCPFCAFAPDKKVSATMPFSEAAWLATNVRNQEAFFYRATDPLDYRDPKDPSKSYADLLTLRECTMDRLPYTSTAYPHGSRDILQKIGDRISRISVSYMNSKRLESDGLFTSGENNALPIDPNIVDAVFFGGTHGITIALSQIDRKNEDTRFFVQKALTDNIYRNFGLVTFLTPDAEGLKEAGRQRDVVKKKKGVQKLSKFSSTIECVDGVLVTPSAVMNSVPVFASERFATGTVDVILKVENLKNGQKKLEVLAKRIADGEEGLMLGDILPYGIVQYQYGSRALFNNSETFHEKHILDSTGWRQLTYNDLTHRLILKTYNESGELLATWACVYHQVEGRIIALKQNDVAKNGK